MSRLTYTFSLLWWIGSWIVIFVDSGDSLTYAPADRVGFLFGEVVVAVFVGVLLWMARRTKPVNHESALPIDRPHVEAVAVMIYLIVLVALGSAMGLRSHVGSLGLTEQTMAAWQMQSASSLLRWVFYYGVFGALVPFLAFRYWRGYSLETLLLRFREPRKWVPYAIATAVLGLGGFIGPEYFHTSILGHIASVIAFSVGTFLPVMILTQCLLAPRFAMVSRSWIMGALLTGLAYAVYHLGEFYLAWTSLTEVALSLAWLTQFAFFGFLKGITTLKTGNAWLHIFNTHTPHLAEAPEIARILRL